MRVVGDRPGIVNGLEADECARMRDRHESRVTPARIVPSNAGVTTSTSVVQTIAPPFLIFSQRRLTSVVPPYGYKEIHRPRFRDLLFASVGEQPQDLIVPLFLGQRLRHEPRGVVQPQLELAGPPRPGAHVLAHGEQGYGLSAAAVAAEVRPGGADDDVEEGAVGGGDAEAGARADDGGTDVQAVARQVGDPSGFERDEAFDEG